MATNTDEREEIKPVAPTEQTKWRDPSLVGKYMVDPKTGLAGLFRSPDNGETWVLTDTVYGHVYNQDEVDNIWDNGAGHKVADEIKSATADLPNVRKQADEAVKFAESAVAASKVNSDAIVAQSSAVVEAKSAMDSATAEIQQLKANAASDVAQIRADVAQVQNEVDTAKSANSASVDKLKSDIGLAQKDLDNVHDSLTKAQSAVEQNQKLINDSVAKINSDIAQNRQDIVTAQQANNDLAKQLDTYSKEAQEQGKTIKTIQDNQDGFSITIADVKGDVTKVSDTVDGLSAGLKDAQGNIASVKAQADQLNATLTDHSKDIAQLTATAKELSSTLEDADGRLSKVEQTASEQSTTLSDLQGNLTQVKQTATGLVTTLKDAQGNIDQIKQDAKGTLEQLSNAQGDITALQKDVSGIKLTIADHDKNIHTLQADSKTLKDDMADAKGNISSLQKTSTSLVSEFKDHDGRLSKVEQTATEHTSELADAKGNIDKVTQKADSLQLLLSDAQKNIQNIQIDAKGIHDTLTGQGNQLATLNITVNNFDSKYSGITGDLQSKQTALSTEQKQTKDMLLNKADKSEVDNVKGTVSKVSAEQKVMADQISQKVSSVEYQTLKDKVNNMRIGGRNLLHNTSDQFEILSGSDWLSKSTASEIYTSTSKYHSGDQFTYSALVTNNSDHPVKLEVWLFYGQDKGTKDSKVNFHSNEAPAHSSNVRLSVTFPIDAETRWIRTYVIYSDGKGTASENIQVAEEQLESGNTRTQWSPNPDDAIASIKKNTTAIDENSKAIKLKADQTEVDNVKNTASYNSSRLNVMANEISSKVTSTDVNNIVDSKGYATTSTVQSLITQKAGTINESITNLTSKVNSNNGGGVNLQGETDACSFPIGNNGNPTSVETYSGSTKMIHAQGGGFYTSYDARSFVPTPGETYTLSADVKGDGNFDGSLFRYEGGDNGNLGTVNLTNNWRRVSNTVHVNKVSGQWVFYVRNSKDYYVKHIKIERGSVATPWTPAPIDNATVTQIQSITASIDGLQSNVTNLKNDTSSRITQLSNTFQSKIGDAQIAINDLKDKTLWKITDSVDLNNVVTQQKIFVRGGSNLPPGAYWWYVQVEPGYSGRIVQYAVSDRDNKHFSRQYDGANWSAWTQDASESEITQLRDDINLRVKKGDLLSQINLTAGNTLIQTGKLYLDSSSVVFSGRAFIPSAAISELDADKLTFYGNGSKASIGAGIAQYDQDAIKSTINLQYQGGFEIHSSNQLGSILTMHDNTVRLASRSQTYSADSGKPLDQQYSGFWAGSNYALINAVDSEGKTTGWSIGPSNSNRYRAYLYDSSTSVQPNFGVGIGTQRFDVYAGGAGLYLGPDKAELRDKSYTTIHSDTETFIEGGNQRIYMHNGEVNIGNPNDTGSATGVHFQVFGWASFNGYVEGMGWTTKSTLSSKTRIEKLDTKDALNKIMETDLETYQYKAEVAGGMTKRHAGPIIDDVHDVAQYSTPDEFINERRTGRSDADVIGYLMGAVQELKKQLDEMKKEVQING